MHAHSAWEEPGEESNEMIITCLTSIKRERVTKISTEKGHLGDDVIIMDNAATISVFRNESLFSEWKSMHGADMY